MARTSRKAAMSADVQPVIPERVYHAAAYVRLSVEDNNDHGGDSIETQRYMLERYISEQADMRLMEVYIDNGQSGTNFDRPSFERMMDDLRQRKIDCVVVKDLSRFARNYVEAGFYLERIFPFLGVRFVAINDAVDTLSGESGNDLIVSIKNLVNDLYAKEVSQKVSSARAQQRKNGEFTGGFAPYGYKKSETERNKLEVDEETAPTVRRIFGWRLEGLGFAAIARRLNEEDVVSPGVLRFQKGHWKTGPTGWGALWKANTIKKLTANPVYAGHMAQGKVKQSLSDGIPLHSIPEEDWVIVRNTHEGIVDDATFEAARELRRERRERYAANQTDASPAENVFRGLVYCADCHTKMARVKTTPSRYVFRCPLHDENGDSRCPRKSMGEPELLDAVRRCFLEQVKLAVQLERVMKRLKNSPERGAELNALARDKTVVQRKITRLTTLRASLFQSFTEGLLTKDEYAYTKRQYDTDAETLTAELAALEYERKRLERALSVPNEWLSAIRSYQAEKIVTRQMAVELIRRIEIKDYNKAIIHWSFEDVFAALAESKGART